LVLRSILLFVAVTILVSYPATAASTHPTPPALWADDFALKSAPATERLITPNRYRALRLDREGLGAALADAPLEGTVGAADRPVLELPLPYGGFGRFAIVESPILAPELGARYPEIRTYAGYGLDDPSATVRLDLTPAGFHALILAPSGAVYIDPIWRGDVDHYQSYDKRDCSATSGAIDGNDVLDPDGMAKEIGGMVAAGVLRSGTQLRTYRAAIATTGEYTNNFGGVPQALAAVTTALNHVNAIYEREISIRMQLVANEDLILYTNGDTDPYTNTDKTAMLSENINNLNAVIGSGNYDVGHVFAYANLGGVAYLGSACRSYKGGGVSGMSPPSGWEFEGVVAHEMGHQCGANHTFNSQSGGCAGNRSASSAYEPGSGSTIMSYAGSCGGDNLQPSKDDYFSWISIQEIVAYTTAGYGNNCAVKTATGVIDPVVQVPAGGFSIPLGTPFALTATATTTGTPSWCWEESDLGPAGSINSPSGDAPIFRSFLPDSSATRTFPKINNILNNTHTIGELMPSYARDLSFKATVRDVQEGGVGIAKGSVAFSVASAGPFLITSTGTSTWTGGGEQIVTWDVAGTDLAPVSCASVNILLSTDGGLTFPTVLVAGTPNDGSQGVISPSTTTSTARVKVEAAGNIFFDISDAHFSISPGTLGACCFPEDCQIRRPAMCTNQGGVYQGFGTICEPSPCQPSAVDNGPAEDARVRLLASPNPGPGGTTILCAMSARAPATLQLFDAAGRMVRLLHDGELPAGETSVAWDGRDEAGQRCSPGVYVARARTPGGVTATKIIMMR
jgi:hypothetical protein